MDTANNAGPADLDELLTELQKENAELRRAVTEGEASPDSAKEASDQAAKDLDAALLRLRRVAR